MAKGKTTRAKGTTAAPSANAGLNADYDAFPNTKAGRAAARLAARTAADAKRKQSDDEPAFVTTDADSGA